MSQLEQDKTDLLDLGIDVTASIEGTVFKWSDALYLHRTDRYAIPTPQQQANVITQAHALMPVWRLLGGFTITSWLRPPDYNALIGGAKNSSHMLGLATDFVPKGDIALAKAKIQSCGVYPGGGETNTTNWVHLDLKHKDWFIA